MGVEVDFLAIFLGKKININNLALECLTLSFITDKQGKTNWQDFLKQFNRVDVNPINQGDQGKPGIFPVNIKNFSIENAQVLWDNQQVGDRFIFCNIHVHSTNIGVSNPVHNEVSMEIQGRSLNNPAKLAWNGIIAIDERFEELVITDSRLVLYGFQLQNSMEALFASLHLPKAKINFTQHKMGIPALELQIGELKVIVSELGVEKAMSKPSLSAVVKIVKFNPKQVATHWRVLLPVTRDDNALTELAATFRLYANSEMSEINQLYGKLDNSYFSGKLMVKNFKKPKLSFDISADKLNLERYFGDKERPDKVVSQVSQRIALKCRFHLAMI